MEESVDKAPSRGISSLFGGKSKAKAAPERMMKKSMDASKITSLRRASPMMGMVEDRSSMKMMSAAPEQNFEMLK